MVGSLKSIEVKFHSRMTEMKAQLESGLVESLAAKTDTLTTKTETLSKQLKDHVKNH